MPAGGAGLLASLLVAPLRNAGRMVALVVASAAAMGPGLLLLVGPAAHVAEAMPVHPRIVGPEPRRLAKPPRRRHFSAWSVWKGAQRWTKWRVSGS
jgi:hypothetical protein